MGMELSCTKIQELKLDEHWEGTTGALSIPLLLQCSEHVLPALQPQIELGTWLRAQNDQLRVLLMGMELSCTKIQELKLDKHCEGTTGAQSILSATAMLGACFACPAAPH